MMLHLRRTITDFLLAGIMGPLCISDHSISNDNISFFKQVGDTNSLKFIRFSKDEAGGLGQSFLNTIALLPYSIVLIGIIIKQNP